VAEVALAVAIVRRSSWAANASTLLLPFEIVYWTGFALPFGFVFGLGRILLTRRRAVHSASISPGLVPGAREAAAASCERGA
jgi:hypothetical protein